MTGKLTVNVYIFFKCFGNGNYFKISLNKMIYKLTLLSLFRGLGRDKKMVSEHDFQTSECDTHKNQSMK